MNIEEFKNDYTQTLLTDLWIENPTFEYSTLDSFVNNLLYNPAYNCTLEQVSAFTKSLSKNLEVIVMRKIKETTGPKAYIINGIELKKDYYRLRTEAGYFLGESPSSLNKKANKGIIKTLPDSKTKKISAAEMYRYYCEYKKVD